MVWSWHSAKTARAPQAGDILQADAHGVPQWARTTGEIAAFHGTPKTPGFPHYLDGLPMSVVSQLGYVDRGIGKRGVFALVDDFVLPWGAISGAFDGAWGPYRALTVGAESAIGAEGYIAGSARLAAGRADAHDRALLYQLPGPFNYVPGRRLWFSTRPSLRKPADSTFPTTGSALIGIVQFVDTSGFLDGWAGDVTHGTSGIFFLKKQGETDWSFYVAQYSGDTPSIVAIPNVVTAALGHCPGGGAVCAARLPDRRDRTLHRLRGRERRRDGGGRQRHLGAARPGGLQP